MNNRLIKTAAKSGIEVTETQADNFAVYYKMLMDWNKKFNLTAITDEQGVIEKHFIDSIIFLNEMNVKENANLIDVGTGAGFPSVPIKIMRPDIQLTLLDSLNKRLIFLQELCNNLNINANIVHMRAEDAGRNINLREQFDFAVSRAVANLSVLSEYCMPLVKIGGYFAAFKGPNIEDELNNSSKAIKILGGSISSISNKKLPDRSERSLILIEKVSETPNKYPRNLAIKKSPL